MLAGKWKNMKQLKGRELNAAPALASQPATGHSLNFIINIVFITLGWGQLLRLAAVSWGQIWLTCLIHMSICAEEKLKNAGSPIIDKLSA